MPTENTGNMGNPRKNKTVNPLDSKEKMRLHHREIRKNRTAYYLLLPFFIPFLLFTVLPIVMSLPMAFTECKLPGGATFVGVENFKRLFIENDLFITALKNTLLSLLVTGLGGFVLSIFAAWLISPLKKPLRMIFAGIFCLPTFLYGAFAVWGMVLGEGMNSPLNSALMLLGVITSSADWLGQSPASPLLMQLLNLQTSFGVGFLVVLSGFEEATADAELYDAARVDGISNRFGQLLLVTLPAIAPRLVLAAVLQIAAAFSAGSVFTTTPANMTLTDYMLTMGAEKFDVGMASAVGVLITAFASLVYFVVRRLFRTINR